MHTKAAQSLMFVDIFTLLTAALCHDVAHTGRSNDFEMKSMSPLAIRYNDSSILEQHHAATTFQLLSDSSHNILSNIAKATVMTIRKAIISHILATDMKTHFDQVRNLKENAEDHAIESMDKWKKRICFGNYLLHCCDLGAQSKDESIAQRWGDMVLTEFQEQAEEEIKLGLDPTPHMHNLKEEHQRAQVQLGFIGYIVIPGFQVLVSYLPNASYYLDNLYKNKKRYEHVLANSNKPVNDAWNSEHSDSVAEEPKPNTKKSNHSNPIEALTSSFKKIAPGGECLVPKITHVESKD